MSVIDFAALKSASAAAPTAPTPGEIQSQLPVTVAPPQNKAELQAIPPAPNTPVAEGGPTVKVLKFEISGNSAISADVLQAQVASAVGKDLTLAELYKVADGLTNFYQKHGYTVARATIPEQKLENGTVKLQVVEGHVGKITVDGNTRTRSDVILGQAVALKSGDLYTDAAVDRSTLLVNDLPGVQAQAVLSPGSEFGTADLLFKTTEQAVSGNVSIDDYGKSDVGRWRVNGHVDVDSPTGSGDKLAADVSHSEGNFTNFGGLSYSLPLGPDGGRLSADYNQSEYRVGGTFGSQEIGGHSKNAGISYLFAQERSRLENFYWGFGVQHARGTSQNSTSFTNGLVTDTDSNTLQLTSYYNHFSEDGSYFTLSGSLSSNGQKNDGSSASAERMRINLDGSWYMPMGTDWSFSGRASGQYSPEPVTDLNKFYLGGSEMDRAFESAEVHGDRGVYLSGEVQYKLVPAWPLAAGWFVDSGRTWNKQAEAKGSSGKQSVPYSTDTLDSSGFELVFTSPGKTWNARLQWAHAFGGHKPLDGDEGGHTWFTIGMSF